MKRIILATTIAAATLAGPALAEQYVCQVEQSTGFAIVQGEWRQTPFEDATQFLIDTDAETVSMFGQQGSFYDGDDCVLQFDSDTYALKFMRCLPDNRVFGMTFGVSSMRFIITQHGYVGGDGDDRNEATVSIGTCAELGG